MKNFMNKLGRERGPLQPINFRLISPAQRLRGYAPNGINSLKRPVTAQVGRPRQQGDWGICGSREVEYCPRIFGSS